MPFKLTLTVTGVLNTEGSIVFKVLKVTFIMPVEAV